MNGGLRWFVAALVLAAPATAEDYAVVISVAKHRSGKHALPMATVNRRMVQASFEALGIPTDRLFVLADEDVTVPAVRSLLRDVMPNRLKRGDRLFLYFTGHGIAIDVASVPTRSYFTFDTVLDDSGTPERDTVLTDTGLADWLSGVKRLEIPVIFFRECSFTGEGYSAELSQARGEAPKRFAVGTYELSACKLGQPAHAMNVEGQDAGIFTFHLTRVLNSDQVRVTLDDLAGELEKTLPAQQPGQEPERGGDVTGFGEVVLIDRTFMTVVIRTRDMLTKKEVRAARVFLRDRLMGETPVTLAQVSRNEQRIFPRIELDGFVAGSFPVVLDAREPRQEIVLDLEPEHSVIEGKVLEASSKPVAGIKIGFELADVPVSPIRRVFDTEVEPDRWGRFSLRVPNGHAYNLIVFLAEASVIGKFPVNNSEPLGSMRQRGPYDMGTLEVTMPGSALPPAGEGASDRGARSVSAPRDPRIEPAQATRYALLLAANEYDQWPALVNPIIDARAVAAELRDSYGFATEMRENPTVKEIIAALRGYGKRSYAAGDELLVFFAGHGYYDEVSKEGFVVARDSARNDDERLTYLPHSRLRDLLENIPCEHILVVLDACFGGTFDQFISRATDRAVPSDHISPIELIERKAKLRTRRYLTSGGKEYVPDGRPGHYSPFCRKLLEALRSYGGKDGILTFYEILPYLEAVNPEPRQGEFGTNEPGSDFVLIAR